MASHKFIKAGLGTASTGKNMLLVTVLTSVTMVGVVIGGLFAVYKNSIDLGDSQVANADLDVSAQDYVGDQEEESNADGALINVKGFGELKFKANQTKQKVNFNNPSNNKCYMVFTLYMPDGSKIYESKLVEPGKAIYEINVNRNLEKGTYENARLHCSCYSMDGLLKTLNGADLKFKLEVE